MRYNYLQKHHLEKCGGGGKEKVPKVLGNIWKRTKFLIQKTRFISFSTVHPKPEFFSFLSFFSLSYIMNLRHQSSAVCIIMLGGEDTHPWSATKVGDPIRATIPVTNKPGTAQVGAISKARKDSKITFSTTGDNKSSQKTKN